MNCEEHNGQSGGGLCGLTRSSSKKQKNKKIPQRGLGVAQLEKIRIEEEEAANTIFPNITTKASPTLPPPPNLVVSQIPYPPLPPPPSPSQVCFSYNKPDYRALSGLEDFHLNSLPTLIQNNNMRGIDVDCWPSIPPIHGTAATFTKLWNPYDMDSNPAKIDHQGMISGLNMTSLPYENSPVGPLPDTMARAQHFQRSSAASLVSVASSMKSLPIIDFQMEPPSNQSYLSNLPSLWPEEEKMVHTKRPYPFSYDNHLSPPLRSKFPRLAHPMSGSDESTSYVNGSANNLDLIIPVFREVPYLQSITMPESLQQRKSIKENGSSNVDFLSLAPPSITNHLPPSPKTNNHSYPNGNGQNTSVKLLPGHGCLAQQHHFFSFMPSMKHQHAIKGVNNYCNGTELGDAVDLDLKL